MTCAACEPLLGPWVDGELEPTRKEAVSAHLKVCPACAARLAALRELGETVRKIIVPSPPADLWDRITEQLSAPSLAGRVPARPRIPWFRIATVAALVLIAVYTGWLAYQPLRLPIDHSQLARVDLAPILEQGIPANFTGVADFDFVAAPLDKAKQQVDFRVFDQPQLTEGYTAKRSQVGCCGMHSLVQTEYRRDKEHCVMFQYRAGLPLSFGSAPTEQVKVGEKSITLVRGKSCWAASWLLNGTGVTIVGPRDRGELLRMVARVEQSHEGQTP